jgi:mycoredoxin
VITMYTTSWCGYCVRLKAQMQRVGLDYTEVNIERDPRAAEFVGSVNGGNHVVPTVVLPDGTAMTNPSINQLLAAVN